MKNPDVTVAIAPAGEIVAEGVVESAAESSAAPQSFSKIEDRGSLHDRRYITAALMLVMVLASMEMTITSTAMPTIIGELQGFEHYAWVASIYLLTSTITMPLYGRLADAFGRKKVIVFSILLFLVASVLASFSRSMFELIICRGIQGLGAGGIMPIVLTILGDIFTLEERARIQGFFSGVWGTASLAGPKLGATLITHFGWRSVFFVNVPFGLIGLTVLLLKYRDREKPHHVDLDLPGVFTLTLACMALLALVSRLGPGGWGFGTTLTLLFVTIGSAMAYVRHERVAANPILPAELIRHRAIGPSIVGSFLFGIGFLSLDTFVPLYVQGARGGNANAAANVVTPVMLTWAISGLFSAPLLVRWGFRKTATLGAILIVIGFTGLCLGSAFEWPRWMLTCILSITGLGLGPTSMSYLLAAQDAVQWNQRGGVTATVGFARSIGGAVGVGVMGALFNVLMFKQTTQLRAEGKIQLSELLDPRELAKLDPAVLASIRHFIANGLFWVFIAMLGTAVIGVIIARLMPGKKAAIDPHSPAMGAAH